MLRPIVALTILIAGVTASTPASAHFSQVLGPLKAQLVSFSAISAPAKMICEGSFSAGISFDWLAGRDE